MANYLETGSTWLNEQRHLYSTSSVTLNVGVNSVDVLATRSNAEHAYINTYTNSIVSETIRYFVFKTQDYTELGVPILPAPSHTITDNGVIYRVLSVDNKPVFRYTDMARENMMVSTKEVGDA